jgi:hypothetical protein
VRDGLYDVMFDNDTAKAKLGMTREELMHDHVHPQLPGAHLYGAGFVAWGIRHMVTLELMHSAHSTPVLARQTHTRHIVGAHAAAAAAAAFPAGEAGLASYYTGRSRSSRRSRRSIGSNAAERHLLYSYTTDSSSSSSGGSIVDAYNEDDSYLTMYKPHSPGPADWQSYDAPPPLPAFVSPRAAQQVDADTFCAAGEQ